MKIIKILSNIVLLALSFCAAAHAVTQQEVVAGAEKMYRERMQAVQIDFDPRQVARLHRVAEPLIALAKREMPETANWAWEMHLVRDPEDNAYCMAGGKIAISATYFDSFNDAELAMLLAHEMQHALRLHNLKEAEEAIRRDPRWADRPYADLEWAIDHDEDLMHQLDPFNLEQEIEADREGLLMAWRAGWPAERLANFFKKTMRASQTPNFATRQHPSPASRWKAARELAATLGAPPR